LVAHHKETIILIGLVLLWIAVMRISITNQFISKASLWYTMRHERNRWEETEA